MVTKQKPLVDVPQPVPCRICNMPTLMYGTHLCDRCWELEHRIKMDPELTTKILHYLGFAVVEHAKLNELRKLTESIHPTIICLPKQ